MGNVNVGGWLQSLDSALNKGAMMNPRHVQLVQDSFKKAVPLDDLVIDIVAEELTRIVPPVTGLDADHSRERQKLALDMMAVAVQSLHAPNKISDEIYAMAQTSFAGMIQPADYDYAANALLRALRKILGAEFTADLWEAWVAALCDLSAILAKSARAIPTTEAPRAA